MTPTSLLPMKALSGIPPLALHPFICWVSVMLGKVTILMRMLIHQPRVLPTQERGLIPGERSKGMPRGPLWLP